MYGTLRKTQDSFSRPNNTTPYVSGAALGTSTGSAHVMEFGDAVSRAGGAGFLESVAVVVNEASVALAMDLVLFSDRPTQVVADGEVWSLDVADALNLIGIISIPSFRSPADSFAAVSFSYAPVGSSSEILHIPLVCGSKSRSLYGYLISRSSGESLGANVQISVTLQITES